MKPTTHRTRSDFGCWTCRVRKKKCDEAYPACLSCTSRGLSCHGYGPKPDWMDGGEKEKQIIEFLKASIKDYHRRKKAQSFTVLPIPPGSNDVPRLVPSTNAFSPGYVESPTFGWDICDSKDEIFNHSFQFSASSPFASGSAAGSTHVTPPLASKSPPRIDPQLLLPLSSPALWISSSEGEREAAMLMNYIDKVFRLQFVCYNPPLHEFGRGWLLAFLTRTKPLYHMACALSAYHLFVQVKKSNRICSQKSDNEFEKHYALALTGLQDQCNNLNSCGPGREKVRGSCEVLACILQMINFELLKGSTDNWQMHLSAASTLVPTVVADYLAQPLRHPSLTAQMAYEASAAHDDLPSSIDELARDFQIGTFTWIDIIRSASMQAKPLLPSDCIRLLEIKDTKIRLDKLVGCENWVLVMIYKISQLHQWKLEAQRDGYLSMAELLSRASYIENNLETRLATLCATGAHIERPGHIIDGSSKRTVTTITNIFGAAALVYLHVVTYGPRPELQEIRNSVSICMNALNDLSDPVLLRTVLWPFCVAGCMALPGQEEFFLDLVKNSNVQDCPIGMQIKALEVVRECWRLRGTGLGIEEGGLPWWEASKRLGFEVLLI